MIKLCKYRLAWLILPGLLATAICEVNGQQPVTSFTTIHIQLPSEGAYGLRPGAEVHLLDTLVGTIADITVTDADRLQAVANIKTPFMRFVRVDAVALLKKAFIVTGDTHVAITRGQSPIRLEAGGTIESRPDAAVIETIQPALLQVLDALPAVLEQARLAVEEFRQVALNLQDPDGYLQQTLSHLQAISLDLKAGKGVIGLLLQNPDIAMRFQGLPLELQQTLADIGLIFKMVQNVLSELSKVAVPAIEQTRLTLGEFAILGVELRSPKGDVRRILKNLQGMTQHLKAATGTANRLIQSPDLAVRLQEILVAVRQTIDEMRLLLQGVQQTTAQLPQVLTDVGQTAQELPSLLYQTQSTLRETEKLLATLQRHWLLRKYTEPLEPSTRIAPLEVGNEP